MSGLTSVGFQRPTLDDIITDLGVRYRAEFGQALRTDPRSVVGQEIGVLAGPLDLVWQAVEDCYQSFDPRAALDAALEAICALTGTVRKLATYSSGSVILAGADGSTTTAGDVVTSQDDLLRYQILAGTTKALATARATATVVATGAVRSNSGNIYVAALGGTTGAGAGPVGVVAYTGTLTDAELDGTVRWAFVGTGLAFTTAAIQALSTGVVGGPAFFLTKIGTARSGWTGVLNFEDVLLGRARETNEALRLRRVAELPGLGTSTLGAILAALIARSDVTEAVVFENVEDITVDGIGPHGVEAVVDGTISDANLAALLLERVAAGIKTYGTSTESVADSRGTLHDVRFTRPAEVDVYVKVTVVADRNVWPTESSADVAVRGSGLVEAAVLAFGVAALRMGVNVRFSRVVGAVFTAAISGLLGVTVQLDTVAITSQVPADVPISIRQIARLDSSRTDVVVTYDDP